jgi:hypothetical protein
MLFIAGILCLVLITIWMMSSEGYFVKRYWVYREQIVFVYDANSLKKWKGGRSSVTTRLD